ncbi:MAG: tetratricopeptide repeat protein [Candidatus Eremiobacteraeota bacterium]|nr:tetratricopeptide repeat protein [Candidatus Eremiobacteraeota bacterium]
MKKHGKALLFGALFSILLQAIACGEEYRGTEISKIPKRFAPYFFRMGNFNTVKEIECWEYDYEPGEFGIKYHLMTHPKSQELNDGFSEVIVQITVNKSKEKALSEYQDKYKYVTDYLHGWEDPRDNVRTEPVELGRDAKGTVQIFLAPQPSRSPHIQAHYAMLLKGTLVVHVFAQDQGSFTSVQTPTKAYVDGLYRYLLGLPGGEAPRALTLKAAVAPDTVPADGRSKATLTIKVTDPQGKAAASIPVTVSPSLKAPGLLPLSGKTDGSGSLSFSVTAPKAEEVEEFASKPEVPLVFTCKASDASSGKTAEGSATLRLTTTVGLKLLVCDENEAPMAGKKIKLTYAMNGKDADKTVTSGEDGTAFVPFPAGRKVNVIFRDPDFLIFTRQATVPAEVKVLCTSLESYVQKLKKDMADFLKKGGFSSQEAEAVLKAKINFNAAVSTPAYDPMNKEIQINGSSVKYVKELESIRRVMAHETGHLIMDTLVDPSGYYVKGYPLMGKYVGGGHNTWVPAQDESKELAFEEGSAEFFAQLFYKSQKGEYDINFDNAKMSGEAASKYVADGNVIEGNIASFLSAYYREDLDDPQKVYRDFAKTIREHEAFWTSITPARSIEEFLDVKLNSKKPGIRYDGDLSELASQYRIKASNVWEGLAASPDAMKSVKVTRNGRPVSFNSSMELKKDDIIEVPEGVTVAFQGFKDGYFKNGEKKWVSLGPGAHRIKISENYNYVQVEFGKAQFVNAGAVSADGEATVTPSGTSFVIDAGKGKETSVRVVEGTVTVKKTATGEEVKASCGEALTLVPGSPLPRPERSSYTGTPWWKLPQGAVPTSQVPSTGADRGNAGAFFQKGIEKSQAGDHQGAEAEFSKAIAMRADYADAYYRRALARVDLKEYGKAVEDYSVVLGLQPSNGKAYYNRGVARDALGDYVAAAADYTGALKHIEDFAEAFYNRALDRFRLGEYKASEEDFTRFLSLRGDYTLGWFNRAVTREKLGDLQGAISDYRKALELRPDYREARESLMRLENKEKPSGE